MLMKALTKSYFNLPFTRSKKVKVLVVDEDQATQYVISKCITPWIYAVDFASNAEDALWKASYIDYNLIIINLNLPVVNGFELSKELKLIESQKACNNKVIGLTTSDHPLLPELIRQSPIDDYIAKTSDFKVLIQKIINWCYLTSN